MRSIVNNLLCNLHRLYNEAHFGIILLTAPVQITPEANFDVHTLTCERDFLMSFWSLKSFYKYSEEKPMLYVHDDGSLSSRSIALYRKHFPFCNIVDRTTSDSAVQSSLLRYPNCQRYRQNELFGIKLFDFPMYSLTKNVFMIDSDVFFFGLTEQICLLLQQGRGFFLSDYQDAYSLSPTELQTLMDVSILPKLNAGLVYFPVTEHYDLAFIERYLAMVLDRSDVKRHFLEQTAYALMASRKPSSFQRLSEHYSIGRAVSNSSVAHHYVSDASRRHGLPRAIKRLSQSMYPDITYSIYGRLVIAVATATSLIKRFFGKVAWCLVNNDRNIK